MNFTYDVSQAMGAVEVGRFMDTDSRNPAVWLVDTLSGGRTDSGVKVTAKTSLTHTPIWQGLNILCGDQGMLPFVLLKTSGRDKERDYSHPASMVLEEPNEVMDSVDFRELMALRAILWGNGYAGIVRNQVTAAPQELLPFLPHETYPVYDASGRLFIRTSINDVETLWSYEDVLHIKSGLSPDGVTGYGILDVQKDTIGHGLAARKHGSNAYRNSARVPAIVKTQMRMDREARSEFRKEWRQMHSGANNSGNVGILPSGMDVQTLGMNNAEAQWLEDRKFSVEEAAAVLNLQPHKLGAMDRATHKNIEEQNRDYLNSSLGRWLNRWRKQCRRKLLRPRERKDRQYDFVWKTAAFLRGDILSRYQAYQIAVAGTWLSPNEVREKEDENPRPGGDVYVNPNTTAGEGGSDNVDPRTQFDQYGIGVRAGAITPQADDERHFRELAGLPSVTIPVENEWTDEEVRRPITLREVTSETNEGKAISDQSSLVKGMFEAECISLVKIECQRLMSAAEKEANFVSWLDGFYSLLARDSDRGSTWVDRLQPCVPEDVAETYCEGRKQKVLSFCNGSKDELIEKLKVDSEGFRDTAAQLSSLATGVQK